MEIFPFGTAGTLQVTSIELVSIAVTLVITGALGTVVYCKHKLINKLIKQPLCICDCLSENQFSSQLQVIAHKIRNVIQSSTFQ